MRRLIYLAVFIILICAAAAMIVYGKLHHRPEWYIQSKNEPVKSLLKQSGKIRRSVVKNLSKNEKLEFSGKDISALILSELKLKSPLQTAKAVKAINTSVTEKNIIIELIIDLNQLHRENFSGRTYRYVSWAKKWLSADALSDFYMQFVIIPIKDGDSVDFVKQSKIRIAGFDFAATEVLNQIGIEKYFIQTDWQFRDIALSDDKLILRE